MALSENGRFPNEECELCHRVHVELAGDGCAVEFDSSLVDAQVGRNLLIQLPPNDVLKNLALARGEDVKPRPQVLSSGAFRTLAHVATQRTLDRLKKLLLRSVLGKEIFGPLAHRMHAGRDVALSSEEDNRKRVACPLQGVLQVEAA